MPRNPDRKFDQAVPSTPTGYWKGGKQYEPDSLFPDYGVALKQPHQMSPDEFASHPYAVFHSNHLDPELVQQGQFRHQTIYGEPLDSESHLDEFGHAVHMGTEQAAMENHLRTANSKTTYVPDHLRSTTAHHHVFWYVPYASETKKVVSDEEANDGYVHEDYLGEGGVSFPKDRSEYYRNDVEDPGHVSLAVRNEHRLRSQSDFVKQAIFQGRGHEVHPETMRQYQAGTLGVREVPLDRLMSEMYPQEDAAVSQTADRRMALPGTVTPEQTAAEAAKAAKGVRTVGYGLGPIAASARASRGPDMRRIRRRQRLDHAEGGGFEGML